MLQMEKGIERVAAVAVVQVHIIARVEVAHVAEVMRKKQMRGISGANHLRDYCI